MEDQIKLLKHQLREQQKLADLGALCGGIAHEIRNPLNFVINFSRVSSKLLKDLSEIIDDNRDKLDPDDALDLEDITADLEQNLSKIREHGERAVSIIEGILLQSRGKEGEQLPTDVCHLIHEYIWLAYHAMRANDKSFNLSIHEQYPEAMPQLMVIPQDMSRAVLNLVNNACYALREKTQQAQAGYQPTLDVTVTFAPGAATYSIEIRDNGTGMSPEVQQRLFREHFTTKPIGQGTGLGLSITHQLVENLHGQISFTSQEGEGTCFTIVLPVTKV